MRSSVLLQRRIPPKLTLGIVVVVLTLAGQWLQSGVHLNHDVSYFVHFDRWLLQGRSLGSDLFDGNLPMVWVLFMPAAALAQWGLMDEPAAVRLLFWVYFLVSTALLISVLSQLKSTDRWASAGWVIAFVLIATLGPGFSFGQREHACILFAMPYLATAVLRLQGGQGPRLSMTIAVGLLAGIGFALKPYFLAVPALIELLLLWRLGWRSLLGRVESLVLGFTVLAYIVTAGVLLWDYLRTTIELALATYWAYDAADFSAISGRFVRVVQPALYGALIALLTRTWSPSHAVMLVAGLGFAVSYFVQAKGFVYHAYPVLVCSLAFLGICLGKGLARALAAWRDTGNSLRFALMPIVVLLPLPPVKQAHDDVVRWYVNYNIAWGPTGQFRQAIIETVNQFAPTRQSYFYAFSTHPFPGFPTASYTAAEWTGRSIVEPFIPALARINEVTDPELRERVVRAGEYQRQMVIEDFQRRPPTIVFSERTSARLGMNGILFDDIAFYLADPRFQQIWKNYEEYPPFGPLRVFVLRADDPQRR
jgi:hypothetical protein